MAKVGKMGKDEEAVLNWRRDGEMVDDGLTPLTAAHSLPLSA